jgi:LuxR family maltose regulon positive regulatory protein
MGVSALGLYKMERGELQAALQIAMRGVERVERSGALPPIAAAVYGELGGIYYHWYELEKAHTYLARSTQVSTLSGYSDAEIFHHVIRSRLAQVDGDLQTAVQQVQRAAALMQADAPAAIPSEVIAQQVRVALLQDDPQEAQRVLSPYGYSWHKKFVAPDLEGERVLDRATSLLYISALRIILYQGRKQGRLSHFEQGLELAQRLLDQAYAVHAIPVILEALLVRAQMVALLGDGAAAQFDVATAVKLAEAEGFITIFLEEGTPVAQMLADLAAAQRWDEAQAAHARRILAAYPAAVRAGISTAPAEDTLVEPLSARELEILGLIGEGYTNQEIADRLVITLHTVKKHSSNIYAKLGVRSRTQAVARAREIGLL